MDGWVVVEISYSLSSSLSRSSSLIALALNIRFFRSMECLALEWHLARGFHMKHNQKIIAVREPRGGFSFSKPYTNLNETVSLHNVEMHGDWWKCCIATLWKAVSGSIPTDNPVRFTHGQKFLRNGHFEWNPKPPMDPNWKFPQLLLTPETWQQSEKRGLLIPAFMKKVDS